MMLSHLVNVIINIPGSNLIQWPLINTCLLHLRTELNAVLVLILETLSYSLKGLTKYRFRLLLELTTCESDDLAQTLSVASQTSSERAETVTVQVGVGVCPGRGDLHCLIFSTLIIHAHPSKSQVIQCA